MSTKPPGALPADVARRVAAARRLAREKKIPLYLAGGAVRDMLLRRPVVDVDLVVEAAADDFASRLARTLGAELTLHRRFGTAVITLADGEHLDIAAARAEEYERPGALPRVRPASITEDLRRRDFTINAMALEIALDPRPRLIDPAGGRDDLDRRLVRFLHPRSAFDDATRAFRAVRYANRLGFAVERDTRRGILAALESGAADAVSGDRLRRELVLLFSESGRAAAVREMVSLRISRTIHPGLRHDAAVARRLRTAERLATSRGDVATTWLLYLLAWMGEVRPAEAGEIAARLNLPRGAARIVREWPEVERRVMRAAGKSGGDSSLESLVDGLDPDSILAAAADAPIPARRRILAAFESPGVGLEIGGRDLVEAGIPAGPAIGRALSATRDARRKGSLRREDELAFALRAARS
jgi:tRNA nucleotidyltransferase (CCA-adding enzyme)